jgi:Ca2+/Na+ antiporter
MNAPDAFLQLLPIILIFAVFYFFFIRPQQKSRKPLTAGGYQGRNMKAQDNEATRLALAAAVLDGSTHRRRILKKYRTLYRAYAPEVGIDAALLVSLCERMERREIAYHIMFTAVVLLGLIATIFEIYLVTVLALIACAAIYVYKSHKEEHVIAKRFSIDQFSTQALEKDITPATLQGLAGVAYDRVNVFVYRGFSPFYFAGNITGQVSFTVDVTKSRDNCTADHFDLSELYHAVTTSAQVQSTNSVHAEDILIISGQDVRGITSVLPNMYGRPLPHIDEEQMALWKDCSDSRVRYYKWLAVVDWGGDLAVSYFIRFCHQGSSLCAEITSCVLTPPGDGYRVVDAINWEKHLGESLTWVMKKAAFSPLAALWSVFTAAEKVREFAGHEDAQLRKEILNRRYDYGAEPSVRVEMAGGAYANYFQRMDSDFYQKWFNRCIIDTIIDFLEAHGVDVSALKESRMTIINSGVLVQGGDVTAQNLAVGERATSKTSVFAQSWAPGTREASKKAE